MFNFLERLDQKWGLKGVWRQGRRLGDILNWIAIVFILVIRNCYCYLWQFTHTLWPLFELDFITHLCCKTNIPLLKTNWHLIWKNNYGYIYQFQVQCLTKKKSKTKGSHRQLQQVLQGELQQVLQGELVRQKSALEQSTFCL